MKLSPRVLFTAGGVLSLLTATLVYFSLDDEPVPATGNALKTVVVAVRDIPERTVVSADMLKTEEVSAAEAQADALSAAQEAVGAVTKQAVAAGEQMTKQRLVVKNESGMAGAIPSGKRAVTIAVNETGGVGGFIRPGDRVDVIASMAEAESGDVQAKVILQDVAILAAGKSLQPDATTAADAKTVTLAVTLDEAQRLRLFKDASLSLALRPLDAQGMQIVLGRELSDVMGYGVVKRRVVSAPSPAPAAPPARSYAPTAAPRPPAAVTESQGVVVYRGVEKKIEPTLR